MGYKSLSNLIKKLCNWIKKCMYRHIIITETISICPLLYSISVFYSSIFLLFILNYEIICNFQPYFQWSLYIRKTYIIVWCNFKDFRQSFCVCSCPHLKMKKKIVLLRHLFISLHMSLSLSRVVFFNYLV